MPIHRAPLNPACEKDSDPASTCTFESFQAPSGWTNASFDDSARTTATEWTETEVGPKDGYDEIVWNADAQLIWGTDLAD